MIEAPPTAVPPALGPLRAPEEEELVAAYPALRNDALTLAWAAVACGCQAARLEALARAGELVLIPGPWPMRQADHPGFFVPAWQHEPGGHGRCPELPAVIAAAAAADWTSLDLHRFMTTPLGGDGATPADLLHTAASAHVVALIRAEVAAPQTARPAPTRPGSRHRSGAARPRQAGSRRLVPPVAGPARPPRGDAPPPAGPRPGRRRPAAPR